MFSIATLRKNLGFITMFFFLWVTFIVLAANAFTGKVGYVQS